MIAMPSTRWKIFGVAFGITLFALLIQINSAENINRHSNAIQNEQNITSSLSNPDSVISHSEHLSKDEIKFHIIQTVIDKFAEILSTGHQKYHYRYKRGNISPPSSNTSSRFIMIENVINKLQAQLSHLNASTSLSTEDKVRIGALETTVKELQTILDSFRRENSETIQIIINKLETSVHTGVIQSIKSGQFSLAEEQLQLTDNSIYRKVVQKVYNNQAANINLLLRFGGSITDLEKKFKLYEALYYEIRNNDRIDIRMLLRLSQACRKGIFEVATGTITDRSQSLIRTLWKENRNSSVKLITAAFIKNESWPLVKQIRDEIHRSCGLICLDDVYTEVIEKVMDTLSIENILAQVDKNLNIIEEQIMIYEAIIYKKERQDSLYDNSVIFLSYYMKKTWNDVEFNNEDWRYRYKIIINKLPRSLRNIVLFSSVCIKNPHYNEYLYTADSEYWTNDNRRYRYIFSGIPKYEQQSPEFKWEMDFSSDFLITFRNVKYNEVLSYTYKYFLDDGYYAGTNPPCPWRLLVDGEGIQMSYKDDLEYLFINDKKRNENMRYVFVYKPKGKPPYPSKWELVDCSDIS